MLNQAKTMQSRSRSRRWLQKHFEGRCRADDNFRSNHQDRLLAHWVSNNRLLVENILYTSIWLLFNHFNMIALQAKVSQNKVSVQAITFLKRLRFLVFCCENYVTFNNQREFSAVILLSKNSLTYPSILSTFFVQYQTTLTAVPEDSWRK